MGKKRSVLDELVSLPWWVNLILAAVVYVALKFWLPGVEFRGLVSQIIGKALPPMAGFFAGILVVVAAVSAYHAWRRGELLDSQTGIETIQAMHWKDFEYLVSEAYRRQGFVVSENVSSGADGGVDLTLNKDGKTILVQCKNWKSRTVGVSTVRELYGVVAAEGASKGVMVISGDYTRDAIDFARGKPLDLVDGTALVSLIGDVQQKSKMRSIPANKECPLCGSAMVLRTAKRGENAGEKFWGCSKFPQCRGTRENNV